MRLIESATEQEWLEHRRGGLGGSDAAAIIGMGATRYSTASKVFLSKVMPPEDDDEREVVPIMVMGQHSELSHLALLRDVYNIDARANGRTIAVHDEHDWMRATVDGWVDDLGAIVELKNYANRDERGFPEVAFGQVREVRPDTIEWSTEPESKYEEQARGAWMSAYIQCQWNMMATGTGLCYLSIWGRTSVYVYAIHRHIEDQAMLLEAGRAFWNDHVLAEVPPPVTADDIGLGVADALYSGHDGDVDLDDSTDWHALYTAHTELKAMARDARSGADALKERFKRALAGASGGVQSGTRYYIDKRGVWSRRSVSK